MEEILETIIFSYARENQDDIAQYSGRELKYYGVNLYVAGKL